MGWDLYIKNVIITFDILDSGQRVTCPMWQEELFRIHSFWHMWEGLGMRPHVTLQEYHTIRWTFTGLWSQTSPSFLSLAVCGESLETRLGPFVLTYTPLNTHLVSLTVLSVMPNFSAVSSLATGYCKIWCHIGKVIQGCLWPIILSMNMHIM